MRRMCRSSPWCWSAGSCRRLHTQFIGEVLDVKAEEAVLEGGLVAIKKMNPLVFAPDTQSYYGIGEFVGKAFTVGKAL